MYKWHLDISKLEQNCSFFHKRLLARQTCMSLYVSNKNNDVISPAMPRASFRKNTLQFLVIPL